MPDPDLEIREARSLRPLHRGGGGGGGGTPKKFFSALQASFWSKNKGGGERAPWAPSLDPLLKGMHH